MFCPTAYVPMDMEWGEILRGGYAVVGLKTIFSQGCDKRPQSCCSSNARKSRSQDRNGVTKSLFCFRQLYSSDIVPLYLTVALTIPSYPYCP